MKKRSWQRKFKKTFLSEEKMSFRISVESVVCRYRGAEKEVLLVKRSPTSKVAPGVWNVPAGKVEMLEITSNAVVRETHEETKLRVEVIKLLAENAFEIKSGDDRQYRNMFTYLTKPIDSSQKVELNHEHTEYVWVTKDELRSEKFSSLMPRLREIIEKSLSEETKVGVRDEGKKRD